MMRRRTARTIPTIIPIVSPLNVSLREKKICFMGALSIAFAGKALFSLATDYLFQLWLKMNCLREVDSSDCYSCCDVLLVVFPVVALKRGTLKQSCNWCFWNVGNISHLTCMTSEVKGELAVFRVDIDPVRVGQVVEKFGANFEVDV